MSGARAMEGAGLVSLWRRMCRLYPRGRIGRAMATVIRRYIHWRYACHISPLSRPAGWINLPHPVGIVVGHDVEIGENATIYQHVTIGQSGREEGYPVVGPGAVIYAGAVVVGPVRIGREARIGANSVVLQDVPDGATSVGAPARIVTQKRKDLLAV
ncbi:serine O-acetyltransferase [Novosphingobium sp. YAF33]|uniref:serine O-acetyltransferase n=1 Tax=Novosphingobium sp. YAF33 TaxID=3233082 RepID=UPI003F9D0379